MAGDTRSPEARRSSAERQRRAYELRLCGIPFEDIARQLGLTLSGAYRAHRRCLSEAPEIPTALARKELIERSTRSRARICAKFRSTNDIKELVLLHREIMRIDEQHAKLLGLHVSSRSARPSPAALELERSLAEYDKEQAKMLELVRAISPEERQNYVGFMEKVEARVKKSKTGKIDPEDE